MMITLSHQQIGHLCPNQGVYTRGLHYYRRGAIKELVFNENTGCFEALVKGTRQYIVEVYLDNGNNITASCNCSAFAHYDGFCKHIAAVLLAITEGLPRGNFKTTEEIQVDRLLDRYSGYIMEGERSTEVQLDLFVRIRSTYYYNDSSQYRVSLKIGESRKYVVRSIDRLIRAIVQQEPLYFGKQFTFDPTRHYFSPSSRRVIDFFIRIHEIEKQANWSGHAGILKGREVQLSGELFKRLLLESKGYPFTLEMDRQLFRGITVTESELPLRFSLQESAEGLILKLQDDAGIKPLTKECDLVLHGEQIFYLPATPQKVLCPLLQAQKKIAGGDLQIKKTQKQRFFLELYPFIEKTAAVTVSPSLQKRLYRPSPRAKVYLDYVNGELLAQLEFIYGEITVDPFAPAEQPGEQEPGSLILIRDTVAEQRVMRFFEEAEFTVRGRTMHLHEDEDIWRFVYEMIPDLQQYAVVYYSERFKQAGVRKAPRFTGRVGIDWNLDLLELELELEGVGPGELAEVWQSLRVKRKYHRLRDGSILPLQGEDMEQFARLVGALELQPSDLKQETVPLPKFQALHLDQLLRDYEMNTVKESVELVEMVHRIRHPAETKDQLPPSLKDVLRDYQKIGFKWMKSLARYGFGGILADDLGLGKTVQAIAFILSEREESAAPLPPALVVAPASLIYNWEAEIKKFAPQLKTLVIAGTKQERRELLSQINHVDVAITSYPLLRRDSADYAALHFSCCFLDEAQYIKNPNSQTAQCVRKLKAAPRFALSGTPMENSLTELWSIFQFIMPGYLQSQKKFMQRYGGRTTTDPGQQGDGPGTLAAKVRPFILRRLKEEVLSELPPKIEHRLLSELTREQKKLYLAYLERLRNETRECIRDEGFNKSRIQILAGLTRLRQICCHPALFVENYRGESAKLLQLQELLREAVDGGHRILLFSQFTKMLQLIRAMLDRDGYRYFYLDGSVKTEDRLQMIESFNNGNAEIFLISLKAGGTGLNLTGADIVIQYDLWWNPAVEEQAAGRAHRIGQEKVVQVIRLLAKDTIEEKIYELQQKKKELIDRVIQPGETFLSAMSEDDLREILEI
ncbi:MAG: SNF2 helicase associated domain-containing protein [Dethiobacteria bacterium]